MDLPSNDMPLVPTQETIDTLQCTNARRPASKRGLVSHSRRQLSNDSQFTIKLSSCGSGHIINRHHHLFREEIRVDSLQAYWLPDLIASERNQYLIVRVRGVRIQHGGKHNYSLIVTGRCLFPSIMCGGCIAFATPGESIAKYPQHATRLLGSNPPICCSNKVRVVNCAKNFVYSTQKYMRHASRVSPNFVVLLCHQIGFHIQPMIA